jgi:hypothetical protein
MPVPLVGSGGLFPRLGKIGKLLNAVLAHLGNSVGGIVDEIGGQYQAAQQWLIDGLYSARDGYRGTYTSISGYLQQLAQQTVIQMVDADKPLLSKDLITALKVLISEMKSSGDSVNRPIVSAGAPVATAGNHGNGLVLVSILGADGLQQDMVFAETLNFACNSDALSGATEGQETFLVTGKASAQDSLSYLWEAGSGSSQSVKAVDPGADNAGSLLTNGGFDAFTGNTPDNWTALVGAPGADILPGGLANAYKGSNALRFTQAAGAPLSSEAQDITALVDPRTVYAVVMAAKRSAGLVGNGKLQLALLDGNNAVITDDAGTNNTLEVIAAADLGVNYALFGGFFRTPYNLPSKVQFAVRLSQAIADAGESVYVDNVGIAPAVQMYPGGPYVGLFSGDTRWLVGDQYTSVIANNYSGGFVRLFERFFGMRDNGLQLPSSGAPTINDALLS